MRLGVCLNRFVFFEKLKNSFLSFISFSLGFYICSNTYMVHRLITVEEGLT